MHKAETKLNTDSSLANSDQDAEHLTSLLDSEHAPQNRFGLAVRTSCSFHSSFAFSQTFQVLLWLRLVLPQILLAILPSGNATGPRIASCVPFLHPWRSPCEILHDRL